MKILRINHLGIVSKNPSECTNFFQNILGLKHLETEVVSEQKVSTEILSIENSLLEILSPTEENSPISTFIEKRGSGIHHIALEVDDLEEWLTYLKLKKIQLIHETPKQGVQNTKIAFIHPKSTGGILVELVETRL